MSSAAIWPPKQVKLGKSCFLVIRAIESIRNQTIQTTNRVSLPSKWDTQEVRLIHTPNFTWSIPSNELYTQSVLKTWTTKDTKWHISLIQKQPIRFEYPLLTSRDILFSEKEIRKVGTKHGITWIHSEKGFRYVVHTSNQIGTLNQMLKTNR